ncbi:MAG: peptidoglycan DD-metalloendopeptidase family protein [Clostridiales bacterium]|nr:peptidoglycan DD-metalloendopeptidase family protein [Clostridiales bacterium]
MARNSSDAGDEIVQDSLDAGEDTKAKNRFSQLISASYESFETTKLYRYFYVTGVSLIRKAKRGKRRLLRFARAHKPEIHLDDRHRRILGRARASLVRAGEPFVEGFNWSVQFAEQYKAAAEKGEHKQFVQDTLREGVKLCSDTTSRAFNYAAPVGGIAVLLLTVAVYSNLTFALSVEYNGQFIGYVTSESEFIAANQKMRERIVFEEYEYPEDAIPKYTMTIVSRSAVNTEEQITDSLIASTGSELTDAYGLYVADKFVGASYDPEEIESLLDSIKEEYSTGDPDEVIEFTDPVSIKEGLYPLTSIVNVAALEDKLKENESEEQTYTVQAGDAPTVIAQKFDMLYADFKALNPEVEKSLLVGQEVLIEKAVPTLGVQVVRTEVYNEEVAFKIEHQQDANLQQGYTKVTQMGEKGINEVTAKVVYVDGIEQSRTILSTNVLKEPVNEVMVVGGKAPLSQLPATAMATDSYFIWPVDGGYVSCGFYGYYGHGAMDIAGKQGMAIRASASGTVVAAYNYTNGAYGRYVVIDHGGGVQTLYAHNSQVYVQAGQWVEQGELIAAMGSTGNSSGNHCHFEIRINGVKKDPAGYIGTVYNR